MLTLCFTGIKSTGEHSVLLSLVDLVSLETERQRRFSLFVFQKGIRKKVLLRQCTAKRDRTDGRSDTSLN